MTPEPAVYLTEALDHLELHALRSKAVDWSVVRSETLAHISDLTQQQTASQRFTGCSCVLGIGIASLSVLKV